MTTGFTQRIVITSSKIKGKGDVDRLVDGLSDLDGVRDVEVHPDAHTVEIEFDPTVISALALQSRVETLGCKVEKVTEQAQLPT